MTTPDDLHDAVSKVLASHRLGQAVFVRYHLQGPDQPGALLPRLAQMSLAVRAWLGQEWDRLYAVGTAQEGQVFLTWQFRAGGTALVSFARVEPAEARVELLVLGNHGTIYHEDVRPDSWEPVPVFSPDAVLQEAITRALHSGRPEQVGAGGGHE
jgi:hypothetical protein